MASLPTPDPHPACYPRLPFAATPLSPPSSRLLRFFCPSCCLLLPSLTAASLPASLSALLSAQSRPPEASPRGLRGILTDLLRIRVRQFAIAGVIVLFWRPSCACLSLPVSARLLAGISWAGLVPVAKRKSHRCRRQPCSLLPSAPAPPKPPVVVNQVRPPAARLAHLAPGQRRALGS